MIQTRAGRSTGTGLPRLLIAAPGPGHDTTRVATGLMAALTCRGVAVSGHKVGPDPAPAAYHALACGRPPRNLDPFLVGEPKVVPLLLHGATGAQVAVIDGSPGTALDARLARLTATPVVLAVDGRHMAHGGALTEDRALLDPAVRVAGAILVNITSPRHRAQAVAALRNAGVPTLGALPGRPALPVAAGTAEAADEVARLGALTTEHVDLDAVLALAGTADPLPGPPWSPAGQLPSVPGRVVAVAGGPAFALPCTEAVELLDAAGARVRMFDPLQDPQLPAGTSAVLFGGGLPHRHARGLAANVPLRESIAAFAAEAGPIRADDAGLLYLGRALDGLPMCGVVPAVARTTGHLTRGYRKAADRCTGHKVTGHECRRTTMVYDDPGRPAAWQWTDDHGEVVRDGYRHGLLAAAHLRVHPAGHPWRLRFD